LRRQRRCGRHPGKSFDELPAVERLDQEAIHAGGNAGCAIVIEGGGEREDRQAPPALLRFHGANPARGPDAAASGHLQIHKQEIEPGKNGAAAGIPATMSRSEVEQARSARVTLATSLYGSVRLNSSRDVNQNEACAPGFLHAARLISSASVR